MLSYLVRAGAVASLVPVLVILAAAASCAAGGELCEFDSVEEARAFGWRARKGSDLRVSGDSKVGAVALQVVGKANMKPYGGIDLATRINLSHAGPGDTISFFVKQNFAKGLWVNVNGGAMYRRVELKRGQWTPVTLGMDPADWSSNQDLPRWPVAERIAFYQKGFDDDGEQLLIDGLCITLGGQKLKAEALAPLSVPDWRFPQKTDKAWFVGNDLAAWAVSVTTGHILGGWNVKTREQYVAEHTAWYCLQNPEGTQRVRETDDRIAESRFDADNQVLHLVCTNAQMPNIEIEKHYRIKSGRLIKQTTFTSSRPGQWFITLNGEVSLVPAYRDDGYYMGAGYVGPLVPAPALGERQKVTTYRSTSKGMLLSHPDRGYSFAHYRYKADGKFVWPWWSKYTESENILYYTPAGWEMSLGTHKLAPGKATSYEQHLQIFPGTWSDFFTREYPSLPAVKEELSRIPAAPGWLGAVKVEAGNPISAQRMNHVRRVTEMFDDGYVIVMSTIVADWASYYVDGRLRGYDGGYITGPELRDYVQRIRAISPRIKVGIYNWVISTAYNTSIYAEHPEWFRTHDKHGNEVNLFPGVAPNYASMIGNDACFQAIQDQFSRQLDYLNPDLLYLDGTKTSNLINWETGDLTRDDQWQQFWLEMNRRAKRHNPDTLVYFNGRGNLYAGLNYIEARSELRAGFWRHFAGGALGIETLLRAKPNAQITPLYWTRRFARDYVNRVLAFGWLPSPEASEQLPGRPFVTAAYEIGNTTPVDARYDPDWKRDADTQLESYVVARPVGDERLLSLISHEDQTRPFKITIDTDTLRLPASGELVVWGYPFEDASQFHGRTTERFVRRTYRASGWMLDRPTTPVLLYHGPRRERIELSIELEPLKLYMVGIGTEPASVYSEDALPTSFRFASTRRVNISSRIDAAAQSVRLTVDSDRDNAEVLVALPAGTRFVRATVDGAAADAQLVHIGDAVLPVLSVERGRHELSVAFAETKGRPLEADAVSAELADGRIRMTLPAQLRHARRAQISLSQSGRVVFNRLVPVEDAVCAIPLPAHREGACRVELAAIEQADDGFVSVAAPATELALPGAEPTLQLTDPKDYPMIPGRCEVRDIDRTIDGAKLLRAAAQTTGTPRGSVQPHLNGLIAEVDADSLTLHAGTTRKIADYMGAAFAGFELEGARCIKLRLENTFHNAYSARARGRHAPMYKRQTRLFAGLMLHYHTPRGYTKKVALAAGVIAPKCSSPFPTYAERRRPDQTIDLGDIVNRGPATDLALDLTRYAPTDWDGKLWLSAGSDWVAANRRLTARIVAVNDQVDGPFVTGTDPQQLTELYRQPREVIAPRQPFAPMIDGVTNDEIWHSAAKIAPFFLLGGGGYPPMATEAAVYYDDEQLFFLVKCEERERKAPITGRGSIWNDDEIEIWLDTNRDGKTYRQIIVNAAGERLTLDQNGPADIAIVAAGRAAAGRWAVEVAIPFKALGVPTPKPGDTWRLNLCRHRPGGGVLGQVLITWAPLERGFNEPRNLATLKFGP